MEENQKRHRRYEFLAEAYLKNEGFTTKVTSANADWGVDVFAEKDGVKYAVQAKMYGDCKTRINRRMMLELYGAMHYFDCKGAMMIYNGKIMPDANMVAEKLGIKLISLSQHKLDQLLPNNNPDFFNDMFETIWNDIINLQDKKIVKSSKIFYKILKVTDGDITYVNKDGKKHRLPVDLFRRIVAHIMEYGSIAQSQLRGEFGTLASAFITTVLGKTSKIELISNPYILKLRNN